MTEDEMDAYIASICVRDTRAQIYRGLVLTDEQYDEYHFALEAVSASV